MEPSDILKSKFTTVVLMVFLIMVLVGTARLFAQKSEVDREIEKLKERSVEIQKADEELSELIKYLRTDEYVQRAARDKLNLKKEGEVVVSIPEAARPGSVAGAEEERISNARKWYNYFFSHE